MALLPIVLSHNWRSCYVVLVVVTQTLTGALTFVNAYIQLTVLIRGELRNGSYPSIIKTSIAEG
jgi:hypothetical protein